MTRTPERTPVVDPQPVSVVTGDGREDWCAACKAYTRHTGDVLMLSPEGVSTVGAWSWCEICDDPADQPPEEARRGR
ncbi:hypothetical protein OG216_19380 [Streptomycetaceae bacterium NBC_01309]